MPTYSVMMVGANHGSIATFGSLSPSCTDPNPSPPSYSAPKKLGDGTIRNLGWLESVLHWDVMTQAQANKVKTFVGVANIKIPNAAGTLTEYTCKLLWPEHEPDSARGNVRDLNVRAIMLVPV